MTGTTDDTASGTPPPARFTPRWWLVAALVAGAALLIAAVTAFAVGRGDDGSTAQSPSQQIAAIRESCQRWFDDEAVRHGGPAAGWCREMAGWMADHMTNGRMMGGGTMMWAASPRALRDVCTRAMTTRGSARGEARRWCDRMVGWMSRHVRDGDDWPDHWGD